MKRISLVAVVLAGSITGFGSTSQAITVTSTYTYDEINRLTHVVYQTGFNVAYAYDPAGNITTVTSQYNPSPPTLTNAILSLQVLTGQNPTGISISNDINQDNRIGLPEVIDILNKMSQ